MDSLLAQMRKDRGMSRACVARSLGRDETTIYLWEIGKRSPNGVNLVALAKLYGVTADTILDALDRQRSATIGGKDASADCD